MDGLTIRQKLLQIQSRLKAPKNQRNNFGNYNYRSCEDIMEGLKPLLVEVGAILTIADSIEHIGERYYIKATATLQDVDSTESIIVSAYAREEESRKGMGSSQVTGSTSSYARKYALNGMFCIDDTKDADATNEHGKGQQQPPAAPPKLATAPPNPKQDTATAWPLSPEYTQTNAAAPKPVYTAKMLVDAIRELAWSDTDARMFIQQNTGKKGTKDLTQDDLVKLFSLLDEQKKALEEAMSAERGAASA